MVCLKICVLFFESFSLCLQTLDFLHVFQLTIILHIDQLPLIFELLLQLIILLLKLVICLLVGCKLAVNATSREASCLLCRFTTVGDQLLL